MKAMIYSLLVVLLGMATVSCSFIQGRNVAADTPDVEAAGEKAASVEFLPPTTFYTPTPVPTNTPIIIVIVPTDTPTRVVEAPEAMPTMVTLPTPTPYVPPTQAAIPTVRVPMGATPAPGSPQAGGKIPPTPLSGATESAVLELTQVIANGNFEEGFGCCGVANGWQSFDNGEADFVWGDSTWVVSVWEGNHAQLMGIHNPLKGDRIIGIFQTVSVVPKQPYEMVIHGLIQSSEGSAKVSKWGNRIQWGVDYSGGTDWRNITNWVDVGWDDYPLDDGSSIIGEYRVTLTPPNEAMTIFIRGLKKWSHTGSVANFYLDGVSLTGRGMVSPARLPTTGLAPGLILLAGVLGLLVIAFREAREVIAWRRGK